MSTVRNRREGVVDSWTKADGRTHSARWGRGKRYLVRWVDEGREYSRSFELKKEAQAYLSELTTTRNTGKFVHEKAGRLTLGDLWEQYEAQSAHLAKKTMASNRTAWNVHVGPRWKTVPVGDVKVTAVRAWVADMSTPKPVTKDGKPVMDDDGKPVKKAVGVPTITRAVGVLRALCELAVDDKRVAANPVTKVKLPKGQHADRFYLTVEQVDRLASATTDLPEVVRFLAFTGLRWSEMAALRVQDFDMLRRRVSVSRTCPEVDGGLDWKTPKSWERRSVPFPAAISDELAALMTGKGRADLVFGTGPGDEGVLRGSNWTKRVWHKALTRVQADDPNFPYVTPHDLRHTAASLAISAGANVKAVQRALGHQKASVTLDVYSDLFDTDLDAVAGALDAKIEASRGGAAGRLRDGTGN